MGYPALTYRFRMPKVGNGMLFNEYFLYREFRVKKKRWLRSPNYYDYPANLRNYVRRYDRIMWHRKCRKKVTHWQAERLEGECNGG